MNKLKYEDRIKKLNSLEKFINGQNQDDILLILDKRYGEDKWSIICSVMHWFRVVEDYLCSDNLLKKNKKDYNWGEVYLFISAVDIVVKGINDIYKIVKNKDGIHLFYGENNIFGDKNKDDWNYFQNIRAIFGAHPTELKDNEEFIVATYPTPYNSILDRLHGTTKGWDYYTFLWSKKKSKEFLQESFGFKFEDINKYLDKYIVYLDSLYKEIITMIKDYKKEVARNKIEKNHNPIIQLNILEKEDKKRLNSRYKYIIDVLRILINTKITNKYNQNEYEKYREKNIENVSILYDIIQNPEEEKQISKIEEVVFCNTEYFTNMSSYYYTKLYEYWNNEDMEEILLKHFKDRIPPFNSDIANIKELYCLVKAFNYYKNKEKAQ